MNRLYMVHDKDIQYVLECTEIMIKTMDKPDTDGRSIVS